MLDKFIVENSSPTLAGIKTANLSSYPYESRLAVFSEVAALNHRLSSKNIHIEILRFYEKRVLIYVYRPDRLQSDLLDPEARRIMAECGYTTPEYKQCIAHLIERLDAWKDFPHEIGLFLGYPVEDVKGFIENCGRNYKLMGYWKVYGDIEMAQKCFECYKKCTAAFCRSFSCGACVEQLAVAG